MFGYILIGYLDTYIKNDDILQRNALSCCSITILLLLYYNLSRASRHDDHIAPYIVGRDKFDTRRIGIIIYGRADFSNDIAYTL